MLKHNTIMAKDLDETLQDEDLDNLDEDLDLDNHDEDEDDDDNDGVDTRLDKDGKKIQETPEQEIARLRKLEAKTLKDRAIARRQAKREGKGGRTTTQTKSLDPETLKDIAEIKFDKKVAKFADANDLSIAQAERVLKHNPNATAEDLKDPFIKAGIDAIGRRDRLERNSPKGKQTRSATPSKPLSEMTPAERDAWYKDQ
jgi:hypothetical protein